MPPTRVPSEADFAHLCNRLPHTLHFSARPSTSAILLLFHGLGDTHESFARFAAAMNLPNVLAISVRGPTPLPAMFGPDTPAGCFHWGDDVVLDSRSGAIDPDPGFARAVAVVWDELIAGVLLAKCGWNTRDILLFGFGQGGSFALALAQHAAKIAATGGAVGAVAQQQVDRFKGVVSLGGPMPLSAVAGSVKASSSILLVQLDQNTEEAAKKHFTNVQAVRWKRPQVDMPRSREEMLPIMQYFAESLRQGW
ncbi:putative hydrolase C9G1.08c [Ceratocystis fimbriata CBS 114723]|uniref:Putative hydrolase C9G1.08c n=1 Tax=Ceratocystis fimbriata CBS 114723 TaxID=1035309 RepID=A0A2C5X811_9PEZI|nr:putative hydrolase C9G1.08c [Ceratocystis fimbriata CBS 114723]